MMFRLFKGLLVMMFRLFNSLRFVMVCVLQGCFDILLTLILASHVVGAAHYAKDVPNFNRQTVLLLR